MHISQLKESKFLKKEDCGHGILVTIKSAEELNVSKEGAPQQFKWCLFFEEQEKPMVLNSTKAQVIANVCGSEETNDWIGHKIVLYHDPNISYQGKLIGGISARAPKNQPAKPQTQPVPPRPRQEQPRAIEETEPIDDGMNPDGSVPF